MKSPKRAVAGAVRWWTPLLWLVAGTVGLIFAAWVGGVDMHAVAERISDHLDGAFNFDGLEFNDRERGHLQVRFDNHGNIRSVRHNGRTLGPDELLVENGYFTVTTLRYDDGELMYWRLPLEHVREHREQVRNPRCRMLMRTHPLGDGEPPGLRVARLSVDGAAARAGVHVGDIITGFDDQRPATSAELDAALQLAVAELAPGGVLALTVERGGAEQMLRVTLEPLCDRKDWDALASIENPVERWLALVEPERRRRMEAEQPGATATESRDASAQEADQR